VPPSFYGDVIVAPQLQGRGVGGRRLREGACPATPAFEHTYDELDLLQVRASSRAWSRVRGVGPRTGEDLAHQLQARLHILVEILPAAFSSKRAVSMPYRWPTAADPAHQLQAHLTRLQAHRPAGGPGHRRQLHRMVGTTPNKRMEALARPIRPDTRGPPRASIEYYSATGA
jgi:hypothetical protein